MKRFVYLLCALLLLDPWLPVLAQEFEQVNTTSPQTLENKTLSSPVIAAPTISGTISGTPTIPSPTITNPTITGTVGGGASYTGPTITSPTITSPTISGTISGTPTIPGPTISSPTISGTVAGAAAYTTPTLNGATLSATKQFYENVETQDKYATIGDAAAACVGKALVITKAVTVTTNLTFGATCALHILPGAGSFVFDVATSASITYLVADPHYPLFSGAGCTTAATCVTFTRGMTVYPSWWGAYAGASAAVNQAAGILAINSLPSGAQGGGVVQWLSGTFDHNSTFYTNSRYVTFRGMGMYATKLRQTTTANLRHTFSCSGTTGYIGVEDIEMSPSSVLTTDLGMKAVNFNAEEAISGGVGCTPAAESVLHVERFKSNGFNYGTYTDGANGVLITYAECVQCIIKVHGQISSSISDPIIFQRTRMAVVRDSDLSCDASTCDHALYLIKNVNIRVTDNKASGFVSEAFKMITQNHVGAPDPVEYVVERNEFRNNGSSVVIAVDGPVTLENLVWRNNASYDNAFGSTSHADVLIEALNLGNIRKCDCTHNYFENLKEQAITFNTAAGSSIEFVDVTDTHVNVWGTSSTGTYVAINYGGGGTMRYAQVGGFFDGGTYGKRAHALMQGGTGFARVDAIGLYEINMASGTTPPSPNVLTQEMGGSATFAPSLQKSYCAQTTVGTDANTTEKDLATFDLPANLFFTDNAGVWVEAFGTTAADANTKTMKLYFNGTVLASSASLVTAPNAVGWNVRASIFRRSSGNQSSRVTWEGAGHTPFTATALHTATDTAAITVKLTGQNGTATANQIQVYSFCVYFLPPNPVW